MARTPADPHDQGELAVGDGNRVHWEVSGNPDGRPAVLLHGGPGSGTSPGMRRWFDPAAYRVVAFDQRGCGRSTPRVDDPAVDLSTNTTQALVADAEALREHLGIERWTVAGASWGTTLGLAYAQAHPHRVAELVLAAVGTTTRREVDWITRAMGRVFPEAWARFRDGVPPGDRDGDLAAAYARLLADPDPAVRDRAARNWCAWEDTHVSLGPGWSPDPRFDDPVFRAVFARLVTHYWSHAAFLPDGALLDGAAALAGIPGLLAHGRRDISGPLEVAWLLSRRWPDAELVVVDEGHGGPGLTDAVVAFTDRHADA
ncbi:prolyl aminopeptidase [Geodermatophilus sp. SYSU D00691]